MRRERTRALSELHRDLKIANCPEHLFIEGTLEFCLDGTKINGKNNT